MRGLSLFYEHLGEEGNFVVWVFGGGREGEGERGG